MKISQLIAQLKALQTATGDNEIFLRSGDSDVELGIDHFLIEDDGVAVDLGEIQVHENILRLVERVGGIDRDVDGDSLPPALIGNQIQEFADLLVKDCAKVADDNFDKGFLPVGYFVKQQYGVK